MESIVGFAKVCRVASASDKVLNSECAYTFHSPYSSEKGILVNLNHWIGMTEELAMASSKSGGDENRIFVRIVKQRVRKEATSSDEQMEGDNEAAAPTKLGIGVEGGFQSEQDKYETKSTYSVVTIAKDGSNIDVELPYTEEGKNDFPMMVQQSVDSVINHVGLTTQQDVSAWQLDQSEDIPVSKYAADLEFVDNGVMIDPNPKSWKCQKANEASDNLWLNLSDGFIGGGRKNWDGSGGTNGALDHFNETGKKYPLVVKLGTISADLSQTDCYSYAPDEDGPVKIPNLQQLLEKRGIQIANLQKTSKSTAELEVELNATYAFDAITEAGAKLVDVTGPGFQGLQNLGNSCYMNSILQLLFSGNIPELAKRYGTGANTNSTTDIVNHVLLQKSQLSPRQVPNDVLCQTTKIGCALTSGVFAKPISEQGEVEEKDDTNDTDTDPKYRLAPRMFKHVVGKDHVDFRTGQQQDTAHYLMHLLEILDNAELKAFNNADSDAIKKHLLGSESNESIHKTSYMFTFKTTSRMQCTADNKVKYTISAPDTIWNLRIPMERAKIIDPPANADTITSSGATGEKAPEQKRHKPDDDTTATTTTTENTEDTATASKDGTGEKKLVPTVSFQDCVDSWSTETIVEDIRWPHLPNKAISAGKQNMKFETFPRYLIVQMQRYKMGSDWTPVKLEVNIDIPESLDLTSYKSTGPQEGEELITDEDDNKDNNSSSPQPSGTVISEVALAQLMDMGFSLNGCKRALTAVGGSDVEAAMNWVFEHSMDPDFNDPLPEDSSGGAAVAGATSSSDGVDDGVVMSLVESLGCFTADQVRAALKETNGAADRAADWLFSHMDDLDTAIANLSKKEAGEGGADSSPEIPLEDGEGKYSMIGMISHIGKHTGSGHYVAHLKKEQKWVIFNDEKVAYSESPPIQHAYMYLFQRTDTLDKPNSNY